jgi:predicted DNA-binding protein
MKSHSLTIRLEADLERELEAVCVETGRSRGDIVRDALHRQLQRMRFERLRAQGMRPIQIWVPDVHSPPRHGSRVCWWRRAQRRPICRPSSIR